MNHHFTSNTIAQDFYIATLLIGIVLLMIYLLIRRYIWQKKNAQLLDSISNPQALLNFSLAKKKVKLVFLSAALLLLMVGLMRPIAQRPEQVISIPCYKILIALDISRSMLAQDCKPNRMTLAKDLIKKVVATLPDAQVGLLVFASQALLLCPMTEDRQAFLFFLDALEPELLSGGSTALDKAIEKSLDVFKDLGNSGQNILILVTDGEDLASTMRNYEQETHKRRLKIFTIGVGTKQGAPIPAINALGQPEGYQHDHEGRVVISRLNEELLRTLADATGGQYLPLTHENQAHYALINCIKKEEKATEGKHNLPVAKELYTPFAFISFLLFFLEWLL